MSELLQLPPQPPQPELPVNSSTTPTIPKNPTPPHNSYSKRQRRPSVRLGDIGVNSFRQNKLSWNNNNNSSYRFFDKSRTRNIQQEEEEENKKVKRGGAVTKKRVRHGGSENNNNNNWYRDVGQSESPSPDPSPMREQQESPNNNNNYLEEWEEMEERSGGSLEDSVRMWLIGLGLGRYEPVFEIHEVDEEVLPLLTLDDLKEMGINAVGSRRKLYSAIQKLAKGFT